MTRIAILDTRVSKRVIKHIKIEHNITVRNVAQNLHPYQILLQNLINYVADQDNWFSNWFQRVFHWLIWDSSHGDAVIFSLVDELVINPIEGPIEILVYDVTAKHEGRLVISLFHVLCALDHIRCRNSHIGYVNMSFLFTTPIPWVEEEIINNSNCVYTCAVGNENRAIQVQNNLGKFSSYPSLYHPQVNGLEKLYPVVGIGRRDDNNIVDLNIIWQNKQGPGSNYPYQVELAQQAQDGEVEQNTEPYLDGQTARPFYAALALFNQITMIGNDGNRVPNPLFLYLSYEGGTSFASPKFLAQKVKSDNNIGNINPNNNIRIPESIVQNINVQSYHHP